MRADQPHFGVIAIGRNEGERLKRCIESIPVAAKVVYVDSGSNDGSVQWARNRGIYVVELEAAIPFTAARARNAGFRELRKMAPDIQYVQFVDGDCELVDGWVEYAADFLDTHVEVATVSGRLRERQPDLSIYNWMCDQEWNGPIGEVGAIGGIVMVRVTAFESAGGFRDDVIAGEEPEFAVRLRTIGWRLWRLDSEMAVHDAAMTHFRQWWRRMVRSGYAFAQGAYLHGASPEHHWVWESCRAWIWGIWLPIGCLTAGLLLGPWGWATLLIYPLQILRQMLRNSGSLRQRAILSAFQLLGRFPEAIGQFKFFLEHLGRSRPKLIEYE